jgi:hypothetical protein
LPVLGSPLLINHHLQRSREVPETLALFSYVANAGPRKMIGDERDAIRRQHVEDTHARVRRLLGIGVVCELDTRLLNQQYLMVRQVAATAASDLPSEVII